MDTIEMSCKIEGCNGLLKKDKKGNRKLVLGYCMKHYKKFKKYGDPIYEANRATFCKIEGCNGSGRKDRNGTRYFLKGYCSKHYERLINNSDPLIVKHIKGENMVKNPLYGIHTNMKSRCCNENDRAYKDYGGRGIKVDESWLGIHGFSTFLADMGERPSINHSLDRIDNDSNYSKTNCRWSNRHEQNSNKRSNNEKVGVGWKKNERKWEARLTINKKRIPIGLFINYDDAVSARREAEIKYDVYDEAKNKR